MPLHKQLRNTIKYVLFVVADYLAFVTATILALQVQHIVADAFKRDFFEIPLIYIFVILPVLYLLFHRICGVYRRGGLYWKQGYQIIVANTYYIVAILFLLYFAKVLASTSRVFVAAFAVLLNICALLAIYLIRKFFDHFSYFNNYVLAIGSYAAIDRLIDLHACSAYKGWVILGYVELRKENHKEKNQMQYRNQVVCLGHIDELETIIRKTQVNQVVIALENEDLFELEDLVSRIQPAVSRIHYVTNFNALPSVNTEVNWIDNGRQIVFSVNNNMQNPWCRILKRTFDIAASVLGGLCIFPVLLWIGAWIYIESPGPVLYKQKRLGRNGREFNCYKFRSMCMDAEVKLEALLRTDENKRKEWEDAHKLKDDPRVTKSGSFLRRTSLDELPQLWNVIRGDMSLVGPRPIVQAEVTKYGSHINDYYLCRPGMTGLWQTSGRSDTSYEERVQMDAWYTRNWNLWLDMVLLARTVQIVLLRKGAY